MKFKEYNQSQMMLFPPSLEDFIPPTDPVRVINNIVEGLNLKSIYAKYSDVGCNSYHPKLMIKIIIYAYMRNVYSSRKIEDLTKNDVRFMWLSSMQRPDHNTINAFRSGKLKDTLKEVFSQIVQFFSSENMVTLKSCYTDGTKIEANANRYGFVWGKSLRTRKEKIAQQVNELWQYAEQITKDELQDSTPISYDDISSDKILGIVNQIDSALVNKDIDPKIKSKLKRVKKDWPEQLKRTEQYAEQMGERNSISKSDTDATFMRMKEDHMGNGQLKPAYNTQISSEKGIITNYTIHQTTTDTTTYIEHTEEFKSMYGHYPENSICDAGYGSEENYLYAEENGITPYIKYNYFHKEQSKKWKNNPFLSSNFYYNKQRDCCYCPMGQEMQKAGESTRKTKTGFLQLVSLYRAIRCIGCPLRGGCHESKTERVIQINHRLKRLKQKSKELLLSPEGVRHRGQRPADVEQAFGNLKWNKGFKRFLLRGIDKVEIEFGLLAIAHNISKYAKLVTQTV